MNQFFSQCVARALVVGVVSAGFLSACGSGGGSSAEVAQPLPPAPVAPAITTQPAAATLVEGQTATFTVVATGTSPQYQWRKNGADIAGAVQATYSFVPTLADDNAQITVRVSNLAGQVLSSAAALRVSAAVVAPAITRQPVTLGVVAGQSPTFSVGATGTALQYQWRRNGVDIAGAVQATYSFAASLADNDVLFSVRISNSGGAVISNAVALRVTPQFVPVSIITQPMDLTVRANQNATFTVTLGGTGPFTWRWFRDGVDTQQGVADTYVTTPSFVFTPAVLSNDGTLISLQITDPSGTVTTRQARLTVLP
jgi:beta-galactosidase